MSFSVLSIRVDREEYHAKNPTWLGRKVGRELLITKMTRRTEVSLCWWRDSHDVTGSSSLILGFFLKWCKRPRAHVFSLSCSAWALSILNPTSKIQNAQNLNFFQL
jgi:hypothetical protein